MIWVDFAIIGLIFISFIRGMLRGVSHEVFSLGFWILAIWVGLSFSHEFSGFLVSAISGSVARIAAAFLILVMITLVMGGLISMLLGELISNTELTFTDRFAGMFFGAARGLIIVFVIIMLGGLTSLPADSWWKESQLIPPFQASAIWLRDHIPSGMAGYLNYH
ncbi:Membrane protein required for colicin V production [Candidatus Methylobacter favarea]|uniref:Membrane protein required for colicin V production n=1 Tax=Candidatus Methylobacter favarea TaxID=2707345 RepID=A0A8S0X9W9_9GAMM|nr:CvpA family protein [Candidatus Methylobacter favarea]CAA9892756.1 Membrane protein required for colicin V production [Candidatus Methylobacter favarea]